MNLPTKFKAVQILYFVDGVAPTTEDIIKAGELNAHVMFRNARAVPPEGSLEACDGVTGKVPKRYASAYPTAEKAIEKRAQELKTLAKKVGDTPAPVAPAKDPPKPATQQTAEVKTDAAAGAGEGAAAASDAADPAKPPVETQPAPGAAPDGSAGSAWKSN